MLSPEIDDMVRKEHEMDLRREVERMRLAKEASKSAKPKQAWYSWIAQQLKERIFNRATEKAAGGQRANVEEPCAGVPC